jgi:hypothetical protein
LLRTLIKPDKKVIKLSKRLFFPPVVNLSYNNVVDVSLFVFIKGLFIGDKKEGFDSEIDNITLTVNSIVKRFVVKSKVVL